MATEVNTTQSKVDANCKAIRQLKWLQKEYWDSYQFEINKLVAENETLLKSEALHAQNAQLDISGAKSR